jgi:RNA polymerase sigma-70 factor (ECF subfamily)
MRKKNKSWYKAVYQAERHRKSIGFMYLEDKDYREIATTLGISKKRFSKDEQNKRKLKKNIKSLRNMKRAGFIKNDWKKERKFF